MQNTNSFNNPFMLGFDELENMLLRISKGSENFPPYNIEQLDSNRLRITLAVAGYQEEELEVSLEEHQLIIRGRQATDSKRIYLHRGIAGRSFLKSFVLAEGLKIEGAFLEHGLLNIDLKKPEKQKKAHKIEIQTRKTCKLVLPHKGDDE